MSDDDRIELGRRWIEDRARIIAAENRIALEVLGWAVNMPDTGDNIQKMCVRMDGKRGVIKFPEPAVQACFSREEASKVTIEDILTSAFAAENQPML